MIICICANKNEDEVRTFTEKYLQGIHTVTAEVIVEIRRSFGNNKQNCGGSCLAAISNIVIEIAKIKGIHVYESANKRDTLIQTFKL
ncbi:MAG: hypothetical protein ACI9TY_001491 [Alphaproteobacteria bacterium]|jgi:hypothetical protein